MNNKSRNDYRKFATTSNIHSVDAKQYIKKQIDNCDLNFYSVEGKVDKNNREVVIKLKY